mmetsp:Transcript_33955/g.79381  ORF Transcript_33955/g.79381 Transcript_33955/m.79381 type:complete len:221 (+) Transcript_33955:76-738(+)
MSNKPEWFKKVSSIHKDLLKHKDAWVFAVPVDTVKMNLHDYFQIIARPMDFGTIKKDLDSGQINGPLKFKELVQLTLANAMRYNPPHSDVHIMAQSVGEYFKQKWEPQEAALLDKYQSFLDGGGIMPAASAKARPVEADDKTPMSYEEKRQLSAQMNKLPGKRLAMAVSLIHECQPKIVMQNGEDPDEIDIDLDRLETPLLRQLERLVKEQASKKKKRTN